MSRSEGWQKQEDRLAKMLGGSVSAGSGAFDRKGDVRAPDLLIEAKWTGKKQFTIQAAVLEKICGEAIIEGRVPVLAISLNGRNYMLLEEADFFEIHERSNHCG